MSCANHPSTPNGGKPCVFVFPNPNRNYVFLPSSFILLVDTCSVHKNICWNIERYVDGEIQIV